jgi:hypothetical protein
MWVKTLYYHLKPLIPRRLQLELRRQYLLLRLKKYGPSGDR